MSKPITPSPASIVVNGVEAERHTIVHCMEMMEQQKERVNALLLALSHLLEPGGFDSTLTKLALELQQNHAYWYRLQEELGIRDEIRTEAADE